MTGEPSTRVADAELADWAAGALPDMLADIERLVSCESPSGDLAAVARSADLVAEIGTSRLGAAPDRLVVEGCSHLCWRLGSPAATRRVLILAHHDTVWPIGSLLTHPFSVNGGVLRGPGSFDMLTGLVMAIHALTQVDASGHAAVTLLVTGDEELGSPTSRELIEQEAAGCVAALVLEAAADGGALKVARKGVSLYHVGITGRAAHAGLEPERGLNATVELAHQIITVAGFSDAASGTTVTPTIATSGTTTNTVAAHASFSVDVRTFCQAEQARVDGLFRSLTSHTGSTVTVRGGVNRPPLERAISAELLADCRAVAERIGMSPPDGVAVGGASDGNITAGLGVPTLDGLGAVGGGAHGDDEHVSVDLIPQRTALLAALVRDLLGRAPIPG